MDIIKLLEYGKLVLKIATFLLLNKFLSKRSRVYSFFLYSAVIASFLLKKFIQLLLLPISVTSILNGTLASYDELILNQYCEVFRRLSHEFSVRYDRAKYWKVHELRDLLNNVYSIYSALYISVNLYNYKLSPEGYNFYSNLRRLLLLFSNYLVKPTNLDLNNLVHIDIYDDFKTSSLKLVKKDGLSKLNDDLDSEHSVSFLSLVHSENNLYVSDRHLTNVLLEFGNLELFEQVASYCNNLFNICSVLKREAVKEQSRGVLSHLLTPPKYTFGNLTFLRSLMLYQFKGVHKTLTVKGWNFGLIDTFFYPDKVFLTELELKRTRLNKCLAPNSDPKYLISLLYGSDVYVNVVDNYKKVKRLAICANPNGGCYELLAIIPSDIMFHVDNGRSAIIYNYPSVGLSRGNHDMTSMTAKSNYLVKYVLENFRTTDKDEVKKESLGGQTEDERDTSREEDKEEKMDKESKEDKERVLNEDEKNNDFKNKTNKQETKENNDLVLSFHGTSLGGYFANTMCDSLHGSNKVELILLHKTFGDMRKMSMHFVCKYIGPLVRFFGLDVNSVDPFLRADANKIIVTDINDEIIPFRCSLAYEIAARQVFPGVGKLSKSFMDYKYKTLQLLNDTVGSTARSNLLNVSSTGSIGNIDNRDDLRQRTTSKSNNKDNTDNSNKNTTSSNKDNKEQENRGSSHGLGTSKGSVNDVVVRIRLVKEMLSVLGKNLNSSGQTLLNLLQSESDKSPKDEVTGTNSFFTRLLLYGSMPYNCVPKTREIESSLVNMYSMLQRLDLNTNYFGLYEFYSSRNSGDSKDRNSTTANVNTTSASSVDKSTSDKNKSTKDKDKEKLDDLSKDKEKESSRQKDEYKSKEDNKEKGDDKKESKLKGLFKKRVEEDEEKEENKYLVRVPPKVAVYFSVLLDEMDVDMGTGDNKDMLGGVSRMESDMVSVHSNSSDSYYFKKRVLFKDGEYYVDFKSLGNRRVEDAHLLEHLKNDLRNFGLSASRYKLSSMKLLSYFKLYSLLNVFNSLVMLNKLTDNQFKRVLLDDATGPIGQESREMNKDKSNEKDELYVLYGLCKKFMYNLVEVLIEEQFGRLDYMRNLGEGTGKEGSRKEEKMSKESKEDKEKEFEYHLNKLRKDQRKYGVVIPQYTGHNAPNSHLHMSLITSLSRYS